MFVADTLLDVEDRITHAFYGRRGGVSRGLFTSLNCGLGAGDDPEAVRANRTRALGALDLIGRPLCTPAQNHGTTVITVTAPWDPDAVPEADAMVTTRQGVVLGIVTADCAPVLFADKQAGVIAAAHAGWRGGFSGVLEATAVAMTAQGAVMERTVAVIGPCIAQASYEVGPEFVARFREADPANDHFFRPAESEGHSLFDLPGYLTFRLNRIGLASVDSMGFDTCADESQFFSFRRSSRREQTDYGRQMSVIALR